MVFEKLWRGRDTTERRMTKSRLTVRVGGLFRFLNGRRRDGRMLWRSSILYRRRYKEKITNYHRTSALEVVGGRGLLPVARRLAGWERSPRLPNKRRRRRRRRRRRHRQRWRRSRVCEKRNGRRPVIVPLIFPEYSCWCAALALLLPATATRRKQRRGRTSGRTSGTDPGGGIYVSRGGRLCSSPHRNTAS